MHKSSIFFLTAITMALFLAACGDKDDNKETPESTKCTKSQCHGDILMICKADGSYTPQPCGTAGCDPQKVQCNLSGETKCLKSSCSGNDLLKCDTATGKTTKISCGSAGCNALSLECNKTEPMPEGFQTVPADQKNTEGNDCDAKKFVAHCEKDTHMIYCGYFYNNLTEKYDDYTTVIRERCADENDIETGTEYKCALWLDNGVNVASCVEKNDKDLCTEAGKEEQVCSVDFDENIGDYVSVLLTKRCEKFSDGKLHNTIVNRKFCSNICSDTEGCITTRCTLPADTKEYNDKCDNDVAKYCIEVQDGDKTITQYLATDCALQDKVCYLDEHHEASCEEK